MKNSIFTIVVCTYNGEKYLPKCLTSLKNLKCLNQYVDKIIVVDNNSNDNTKQIIRKFEKENDIFEYHFEKKQGLSYARAHAIDATTDWIIYVDDDNILDENWLEILYENIQKNQNVGVFNGAVIACPDDLLTETEKIKLQAIYRNLACTHLSNPKPTDKENLIPIGAGMCVRLEPLKKIYNEGWLKLVGRKGESLSSGEDTELCERIFSQGYAYKCDYNMIMYHIIPKTRLSDDYIFNLIKGLVKGRVNYIKNTNFSFFKLMLRKVKYLVIFFKCYIIKIFNRERNLKYWKNEFALLQAKCYLTIK